MHDEGRCSRAGSTPRSTASASRRRDTWPYSCGPDRRAGGRNRARGPGRRPPGERPARERRGRGRCPTTATTPIPIPIGHMPWTIAHTQVSGTSHQRSRPSSRVRSQAASGDRDQQVAEHLRAHRQISSTTRSGRVITQERHRRRLHPAAGHEVQRRDQRQDQEPRQPGDARESEPVCSSLAITISGQPLGRHPRCGRERADRAGVAQGPAVPGTREPKRRWK